jgi:trk system potassium uptake protein TrkH
VGGLSLIAIFGWLLEIEAAGAGLAVLVALARDEAAAAQVFLVTAALMAFVGTGLVLGFRGHAAPSRRRHGLALILMAWVVLPAFAAVPFVAMTDSSPVVGYFEAVSVFTTTGATTLAPIDELPRALVFWRAALEWLGGALTIVAAAAAIDSGRNAPAGGIHLLSSGIANVQRLSTIAREIVPLYVLVTLICGASLSLAGIPAFDAFCLALSTVSTGGAMPIDGDLAAYQVPAVAPLMAVFMIIGASNFVTLRRLRWHLRGAWPPRPAAIAWLAAVALAVVATLALVFLTHARDEDVSLSRAVLEGAFTMVSLMSTSAFIHDRDVAVGAPLALIVSLALVGGAYGSTAGGLKLSRVMRMLTGASRELDTLIHPSIVAGARLGRAGDEPQRILWSYLIAFLLMVVVVSTALAGFGLDFEASLYAAVGAISNAGPVVDYLGVPGGARTVYASVPEPVTGILALAMIAGRIEVLALFTLLTPLFWTR